MSRRRRLRDQRRWWQGAFRGALVLSAAVLVAPIGYIAASGHLLGISAFWPLDLYRPPGSFVQWQPADQQDAPALCSRVLVPPSIVARPVVDDLDKDRACGRRNAVRVETLGEAHMNAGPVTCELSASPA